MVKKKKKTNFWKEIRFKYRLTILNEKTLEDVFIFRASGLSAFVAVGLFAFFLIALTAVVIINTPIRNYLPGYMNSEIRRELVGNALKIDSLESVVLTQSAYLDNLGSILRGDPVSHIKMDTLKADTALNLKASELERLFLTGYEEQEMYNLSSLSTTSGSFLPENVIFFRPVRGIISSKYDVKEQHYGVDIAASSKESVLATLNGTVVFTGYDLNVGYVIHLQHKNGLISIYKHNGLLLKKMGENVVAGEAIALVGNTGKLSTGSHLHFEIWYNGIPIDPESVIVF